MARFKVTDVGAVDENELKQAAQAALAVGSYAYDIICDRAVQIVSTAVLRNAEKSKAVAKIAARLGTTSAKIVQRASVVLNVVCLPSTLQDVLSVLRWIDGFFGSRPPCPDPPTNLTLVGKDKAIQVSWTPPTNAPQNKANEHGEHLYSVAWGIIPITRGTGFHLAFRVSSVLHNYQWCQQWKDIHGSSQMGWRGMRWEIAGGAGNSHSSRRS